MTFGSKTDDFLMTLGRVELRQFSLLGSKKQNKVKMMTEDPKAQNQSLSHF
jgi:hypothetical protein